MVGLGDDGSQAVTTATLTLTEFLEARIAEDEAVARSAGHGCGYLHEHNGGWVEVELPGKHNARPGYELRYIRNFNPARVLAECAAKRRIVETRPFKLLSSGEERQADRLRDQTLRILASVYAHHADYRPEWRP